MSPQARATVRRAIRWAGLDRECPYCRAAAGSECTPNELDPVRSDTGEPDVRRPGEPRAVCPDRTADGGLHDLVWMALTNKLLLCTTDADFDAYLPEMEPIRLALWPEFDPTVLRENA